MKLKRKIEVCWRAGGTPAEISTQFGPDWLCELGDKSYKPQFFFSISMKNGCLVTTVFNFVIKFAWTFFSITTCLGQLCSILPKDFFVNGTFESLNFSNLILSLLRGIVSPHTAYSPTLFEVIAQKTTLHKCTPFE